MIKLAPRPPLEIKLHVHVATLLREHCLPDWRWTHINRKAKDAREGDILNKMGVNKGWPDFLLLAPRDRTQELPQIHGLEVKRLGKKLTEEQEEWADWVLEYGGKYSVVQTIDEAIATLSGWGCLRVVPA